MLQYAIGVSILAAIAAIAKLVVNEVSSNREKARQDAKLDDALAQSMHGSESTATY